MAKRLMLVLVLVLSLMMVALPAQAQEGGGEGGGEYVSCADYAAAISGQYFAGFGVTNGTYAIFEGGIYTFTFDIDQYGTASVTLVDGQGGTLAGPIALPGELSYTMSNDPAEQPGGLGFLVVASTGEPTMTVDVSCTIEVPGCDTQIPITADAVVGSFVSDAATYWSPGNLVDPLTTIGAGNTAWVLGLDDTGQFWKIIWVCDILWVPVGSMGPNFDEVWNGTPLPTGVVE